MENKKQIKQEIREQIEQLKKDEDSKTLQVIWYILADQPEFYKLCADALDYIYIKQQLEIRRVKSFFEAASQIVL